MANAKGKCKRQVQAQVILFITLKIIVNISYCPPKPHEYSPLFTREGWPTKEVGVSWVREFKCKMQKANGKRQVQAQVILFISLKIIVNISYCPPKPHEYSPLFAREGWPTKEVGVSWVR